VRGPTPAYSHTCTTLRQEEELGNYHSAPRRRRRIQKKKPRRLLPPPCLEEGLPSALFACHLPCPLLLHLFYTAHPAPLPHTHLSPYHTHWKEGRPHTCYTPSATLPLHPRTAPLPTPAPASWPALLCHCHRKSWRREWNTTLTTIQAEWAEIQEQLPPLFFTPYPGDSGAEGDQGAGKIKPAETKAEGPPTRVQAGLFACTPAPHPQACTPALCTPASPPGSGGGGGALCTLLHLHRPGQEPAHLLPRPPPLLPPGRLGARVASPSHHASAMLPQATSVLCCPLGGGNHSGSFHSGLGGGASGKAGRKAERGRRGSHLSGGATATSGSLFCKASEGGDPCAIEHCSLLPAPALLFLSGGGSILCTASAHSPLWSPHFPSAHLPSPEADSALPRRTGEACHCLPLTGGMKRGIT